MFASLKRVLQRDRDPAHDKVTSRRKIVALLRQLQHDHELLCIKLPGFPDQSNTAIIGVKDDHNYFLLDELSNPAAHEAFLKNRKALVECRLRGMELHFGCRLLKVDTRATIAVYAVSFPERIARTQRRGDYRLRLSHGLVTPLTVPHFEGRQVSGEVFDLSIGGLGAFLNTRSVPNRAQVLPDVSVALPQSRPFNANLEIRFARLDSAHRMLRIGARFINLDSKQQRQLSQFLAEQQRKRRRHESY